MNAPHTSSVSDSPQSASSAGERPSQSDGLDELMRQVARAPSQSPRGALAAGTCAGDYQILEEIGRGAFGTVYKAVHPLIGKAVAVKVLDAASLNGPAAEQRFIAEARAVNRINHRNIVDIFGFGQLANGQKFCVMELLSGETLAALIARQKTGVSAQETLRILEPLADALDAAHAVGILHRDLKPANVFLTRVGAHGAGIKLLDFGIAKMMEGSDKHMTSSGLAVGTPAYMAPEQSLGGELSGAADIYAFGVMTYEMLVGQRPFVAADARSLLQLHLFEPPAQPSFVNTELPSRVDSPLLAMLAKDPQDRPASASEAIRAIRRALGDHDSKPRIAVAKADSARVSVAAAGESGPVGRRRLGFGLAALGLFALAGTALGAYGTLAAAPRSPRLPEVATDMPHSPAATVSVSKRAVEVEVPPLAPAKVSLRFFTAPPRAQVFLGPRPLGFTDGVIEVERSAVPIALDLTAPGYTRARLQVVPDRDQLLEFTLAVEPPPRPRPRAVAKANPRESLADPLLPTDRY